MNLPLTFLAAAALAASVPFAATAQTGPTASAASAGASAHERKEAGPTERRAAPRRPVATVHRLHGPGRRLGLRPPAAGPADRLAEVELRPKAEWLEDEGLSLSPTRLAFKHRF